MDIAKLIEERELEKWHVFSATIIGMFAQLSGLNQNVVNIVTRRLGEVLVDYYTAEGQFPLTVTGGPNEYIVAIVEFINEEFGFCSDMTVDVEKEKVELQFKSDKCRICPKGVGHVELVGTGCPFPGLFDAIFEKTMDKGKFRLVRTNGVVLKKIDEHCIIEYLNK